MKKNKKKKEVNYNTVFLLSVILFYLVILPFKPDEILRSFVQSIVLLVRLVPVLFLVILIMGAVDYFVNHKTLFKYIGRGSGIKGWILAISAGILSHGPIYAWFPLLKEFKEHGMKSCLAAVFLYNRAVKIPLMPIMIYYFDVRFVILLFVFTVIGSIIEGKIIEILNVEIEGEYLGPLKESDRI